MVWYGTKDHSVIPPQWGNSDYSWTYSLQEQINLEYNNCIDSLIFIQQVHGAHGIIIDDAQSSFFKSAGDFIVTNQSRIGIGVLTADCVPLVLHDPKNHCLAVVHAGWRGTVNGVVENAVRAMQKLGCDLGDISVSFGPAARACCYQVGKEVADQFLRYPWGKMAVQKKEAEIYLDLVVFITLFLNSVGIATKNSDATESFCTICNPIYCSYRRDGIESRRNVTIAWLGEKPGNSQ